MLNSSNKAKNSSRKPPNLFASFTLLFLVTQCMLAQGQNAKIKDTSFSKSVSITFDDLPLYGPAGSNAEAEGIIRKLLSNITAAHLPATGFVNGQVKDKSDTELRDELLRMWIRSGVELGNHSYSHLNFSETELEQFENDFLQCDRLISGLMWKYDQKPKFFRYPYLNSGVDLNKRRLFEQFLAQHGYRVVPATIVSYEWLFADLYADAILKRDKALSVKLGDDYIKYMRTIVDWHETFSHDVFGTQISHILLLHASRLNADYLPKLLQMLRQAGYRFVPLGLALNHAAYALPDAYPSAEGVSWMQRVTSDPALRFRHEPCLPVYVRLHDPDHIPCVESNEAPH